MSAVARRYGLQPSHLFKWKASLKVGRYGLVRATERSCSVERLRELERYACKLEHLLGRKIAEHEILKEELARLKARGA